MIYLLRSFDDLMVRYEGWFVWDGRGGGEAVLLVHLGIYFILGNCRQQFLEMMGCWRGDLLLSAQTHLNGSRHRRHTALFHTLASATNFGPVQFS